MGIEIERKWLVSGEKIPSPNEIAVVDVISQAYVLDKDHTTLRVRAVTRFRNNSVFNNFGVITVKSPSSVEGAVEEREMDIPRSVAETLISACDRVLYKTRLNIPFKSNVIELDVFEEKLDGLVIAEVEFPGMEEADAFVPPSWFGKEVTGNHVYTNSNLIKLEYPPA